MYSSTTCTAVLVVWALEAPGPRVGKVLMRAIASAHQYRAQSNSCTSFEGALHGLRIMRFYVSRRKNPIKG